MSLATISSSFVRCPNGDGTWTVVAALTGVVTAERAQTALLWGEFCAVFGELDPGEVAGELVARDASRARFRGVLVRDGCVWVTACIDAERAVAGRVELLIAG